MGFVSEIVTVVVPPTGITAGVNDSATCGGASVGATVNAACGAETPNAPSTSTVMDVVPAALPVAGTVNVGHTSSTYGAPVLAGEGDNSASPIIGSFINFRQYTQALTQTQIAALYTSDAPSD